MTDKFDGFAKSLSDSEVEQQIADHCEKHDFSPLDAAKHWMVLGRRQWIKRFLAHSELFQMTLDVPGDIAELGVFRGMGLFTWANLLESYCIGDRTKTVWGFDNWEGFTAFSPEDGKSVEDSNKMIGGFSPKDHYQELLDAIKLFDDDRFIPQKPRIKLVEGQIEESCKQFVEDNPGVRFSLIHFDCDLYAPTKAALEAFWPLLSRGGVMLFDEYGIQQWPGETKAVDEFFADKPGVKIKTLPWTNAPAGYLVKE
ncbi:TylF/MycF/NovP-related O-methyltransferase [Desulfovibrio sp. JC022]|uniref:TylF/MycF/NovP-related O-methyltransferase n=1 Tax=Desulfovibrio sp. JC022 TaxID=2593642 RepID=UPI0013D3F82F|nr:TylF/MycF/NovP-related O-methyltransferase [Desulfovibrio sp. JC022]NDV22107.1 macrocin-O-methyltransferase [Desulfovibrio sp. JC022]